MGTPGPAALVGREKECAAIDRLLEVSAGGESSSLVLRGEAGIGKTALLTYAAERGGTGLVLRTAGVEAESDLGFAGLYGLLRPIVEKLGELPETQGAALVGGARACSVAWSRPFARVGGDAEHARRRGG